MKLDPFLCRLEKLLGRTILNIVITIGRRLDDIESLQSDTIDFMWVDVQGAEDIVFTGAEKTLTRTRYVYTEYATNLYEGQLNREQLLALFGPNWSIVHDYGGDLLLKNIAYKQ